MKSIADMTRLELAGLISSEFQKNDIDVVLSGGSCVSIYSEEKYVSMDLDFVNAAFTKRNLITGVMRSLGFNEEHRYFRHPDTDLLVEFPPGPLGVGEEPVKQVDEIKTTTGVLRLISPTDCVKDRLTWYYHDVDLECLRQAVLVSQANPIDIKEVERWSKGEGRLEQFKQIRKQLERKCNRGVTSRHPTSRCQTYLASRKKRHPDLGVLSIRPTTQDGQAGAWRSRA